MDTEEAITEFVKMLKLGTAALREVASNDPAFRLNLNDELNQLLHLADSIDDVGDSMRTKSLASRRGGPASA